MRTNDLEIDEIFKTEKQEFDCPIHGIIECEVMTEWSTHEAYCPDCAEAERIRTEKAEKDENNRRAIRAGVLVSGVTPLFYSKRYDDFETQGNPLKGEALSAVRAYADNFKSHSGNGENLLLLGDIGTGKTHLGSCLVKQLVTKGYQAKIANLKNIIREVRNAWKDDSITEEEVFIKYTDYDLLVIDEVGRGKATEDAMDIACEIIDRRYTNIKPTVVLGNVNLEKMADYVDPRGVDRLMEKGLVVAMSWESHRRQVTS